MGERTAAVVGATGLTGAHLVEQLVADQAYSRVLALVRRPLALQHEKLEIRIVDFERLAELTPKLEVDDAYCALGTTIKRAGSKDAFSRVDLDYVLAFAHAARSASQLLVVSSVGASSDSSFFYNRVKGQMEEALVALSFPTTLIFRPSFLVGEREQARFGERVGIAAARVFTRIPIAPLVRLRPIEARTVACGMIGAAKQGLRGKHVFESGEIPALCASS